MPETAKPSTNQNRRYLLLLGWVTFILPGTLFGEQQDPCDECDISLVNGIYENRVERGDRSATSDLASYLCHLSYGDFKKLIAKSGRAGFEIFSLSGDANETEFNQAKSELQKRLQIADNPVTSQQLLERHADLGVWERWGECRASCNREGANSWIKNAGYGSFLLYIDYIVKPGEQPRIITLGLTNADPLLQEPLQFQLAPGITTRSIHRREESMPVEIDIGTTGWNQKFVIQPDLPATGAAATPIITPTPEPTPTSKGTPTTAPIPGKKSSPTVTPGKTPRRKHHRTEA